MDGARRSDNQPDARRVALKPVNFVGMILSAILLSFMVLLGWRLFDYRIGVAIAWAFGWFLCQCVLLGFICEGYARARRRDRQFSLSMLGFGLAYLAVDFALLRFAFERLQPPIPESGLRFSLGMLFGAGVFIVLTTLILLHGADAIVAIAVNVKRLVHLWQARRR